MNNLVRCPECEGWGITSYEKDGSPNACVKCKGAGAIGRSPASTEPLYGRFENLCREAESRVGCGRANPWGTTSQCGEGGQRGWYCDQCKAIRALTNVVAILVHDHD